MNRRILLAVSVIVFLAGASLGQMHGGVAGGGMSGGTSGTGMGKTSMGGMQSGSQQGMGSMGQGGSTMTPMQRRQLMHTTAMQDQKYQASAHAMGRVQGDLSRMQSHGNSQSAANASSSSDAGSSSDAQQGSGDPSDALSSDLQDLEQSNDDLASSLNSDQQAVVANKLKDLDKKTKEMQSLAQQLKTEMANLESDPKVVREHTKRLDKLSKEIATEQHEVASALGLSV